MQYSIETDKKWQKEWDRTRLYKFNKNKLDNKIYCLEMFSYPSGSKLHIGHWFNFAPTDTWARMKRMQGHEVFHPMGFDAFGLPAENYAIKTGVHPEDSTYQNIATMREQLKAIGTTYDWDHEVITCSPEYYRWTQWLFLKLYKAGLAYRKEAPVNWCPGCKTVLANEQVVQGECERCSSQVTKKELTQWFFKITDYAQRLLDGLEKLDWPNQTKKVQTNWIGKSVGAEVSFKIHNSDKFCKVFTTRVDTIYGVSFLALAPEHDLLSHIVTKECEQAVKEYQESSKLSSEIERLSADREKTGVFTGSFAEHPFTGDLIPIWACDYVLASYGTGSIMGVPAHDDRDEVFAKKYDLLIQQVIKDGKLINSESFDGLTTEDAATKIVVELEKQQMGQNKTQFRLRDWLVSRQRYWGAPIPIIYCQDCGTVPVPEDQLPVKLPYDVEFSPDGDSPLYKCEEFMNVACPDCGKMSRREADTLDTFVDSSWYFLRYPDNKNQESAFDPNIINKILPVDKYVGGYEHAAMHLLYARFITKALYDLSLVNFDEPFTSLVHQGIILGPDGNRMSKSKGNVVSPDEYVEKYGSDVFRLSMMFGYAYTDGGPWSDDSITAIVRFVGRIERLIENYKTREFDAVSNEIGSAEKELDYWRHTAIKGITEDTERFSFNTSISRLMELCNALYKYDGNNEDLYRDVVLDFLKLLAPFTPHLAEELWASLGQQYSVFNQGWPKLDTSKLGKETTELGVQINGSLRCKVEIPTDLLEQNDQVQKIVLGNEKVKSYLEGKEIAKVIVVPKRLISIVAK